MENKSRTYCVTDYILDRSIYDTLGKITYMCAGDEICPSTKKPHWQIFIRFADAKAFNALRKKLAPRHIEIMKGTVQQNLNYCTKEKIAFEIGTRPNPGKRTDLDEIRRQIEEGVPQVEIAANHFSKWCVYRRSFEEYRGLLVKPRDFETEVEIICGPPGCGKSRSAYEQGALFLEYENNFFLNYDHQEIVCFDDFEGHELPRKTLLRLCDRYPLKINVKGGSKEFVAKKIIFTSNRRPEQWLVYDQAFARRIKKITSFF